MQLFKSAYKVYPYTHSIHTLLFSLHYSHLGSQSGAFLHSKGLYDIIRYPVVHSHLFKVGFNVELGGQALHIEVNSIHFKQRE
jgi:hypothetical protein